MPSNEKVGTADQGGRINLGQSRAGHSFRLVEQGSQLILEPVETVHLPPSEAWLFRNKVPWPRCAAALNRPPLQTL